MKITFKNSMGSLGNLVWEDIPSFAVLTGVNGAGKSQLLEAIASVYGVQNHDSSMHRMMTRMPGQTDSGISIEGAEFQPGEVFYSQSAWNLSGGGAASVEEIKQDLQAASMIQPPGSSPPWIIHKLAERTGKTVAEVSALSPADIEKIVTPTLLWGGNKNLAFLCLTYRILENLSLKNGKTDEQVALDFGEKPWDILNRIFSAASLPYTVVVPAITGIFSLIQPESYYLELFDIERNCKVPYEKLSSGERVIMSTALWLFDVQEVGRHFKLLLLDEPDAHLHPSMTRRFLDVIQKIFVEEHGVHVIMTTHSPSTVALCPQNSLFEMRRSGTPRIEKIISKPTAISKLTDGFLVVHEGMLIVLCEGSHDVPFYSVLWDMLTEQSTSSTRPLCEKRPSLMFMHGNGITTVRSIISQLRSLGLHHFHGVIDFDDNNQAEEGISVIGRRALENYLFDPINTWGLLHNEQKNPPVIGVNIPRGRRDKIRHLHQDELQKIANVMFAELLAKSNLDTNLEDCTNRKITFVDGKSVVYPNWFMSADKAKIKQLYINAFPRLQKNTEKYDELITSFAALNMVPKELAEIFINIQRSSRLGQVG